jgi:hypothetical protein
MGLMHEALQDWELEENGAFDESDNDDDDEEMGPDDDDDDRRPPGGGDGPSGPSGGSDPGNDEGDPWSGDLPPDMDGAVPPDEPIDQSDVSSSSSHPDSIPRDQSSSRVAVGHLRGPRYLICPSAVFVPVRASSSATPAVASSDVPPPGRRVRRSSSLQTPGIGSDEPMDSVDTGAACSSTSSSDVPPPRRRQRAPDASSGPGRDQLFIRVSHDGSSSRREVLRAPESPPSSMAIPPVVHSSPDRMDEEPIADIPPGEFADDQLEDGIPMARILSRMWMEHVDSLPSVSAASSGYIEREGELSYVRATYAWELAVLHRNMIVRLLTDEWLDVEARRTIEE